MLYDFIKECMLKNKNKLVIDDIHNFKYSDIIILAEELGEKLTYQKYGILCKSELNTAIALLSCLYAGKTAVLLSERYGEKHNNKIIESIKISHIITDNGIIDLKQNHDEPEDLSDVALIMCTSGTTGNPKGAMITYENIFTNLIDISTYFNIDNSDTILISRPLYHCAVLTGEFLISLIKGLDIIFTSDGFNPYKLLQTINKYNISVMCGTPTIFNYLANLLKKSSNIAHIKKVAVSGECMSYNIALKIFNSFNNVEIYSVYGLTEASPRVSYLPPWEFIKFPTSVGIALNSVKVKIHDNELMVKGKSIMKGYYNNYEATAAAIKDGWLHTGDIAELDSDGRIYIKSRKDNLIIRAGMNIYPQEIEAAIKQDERISEAIAYGVNDENTGQKIHLTVVSKNLSKNQVMTICNYFLPKYQIPDFIEFADSIQKNASGKVVRSK